MRTIITSVAVIALMVSPAFTDDKGSKAKAGGATKEVTLTGCMAAGETAGQFSFSGKGGRKLNVSGLPDLSSHVGHTVKITGTRSGKDFTATKIEHVSDTCMAPKAGARSRTGEPGAATRPQTQTTTPAETKSTKEQDKTKAKEPKYKD
ncbi:MAG: hypothetical protein HYS04_17355 [Acidobacteria bacterium]|nr:hypothetical protein [Acidobacteriota bacterium]